jgi:hypothetical protein
MGVESTTTLLGLSKFNRGNPVRDIDIGTNMDLIDAECVSLEADISALETSYEADEKMVQGSLTAGSSGDISFYWQNPEAVGILVNQVIVDVTAVGGTGTSEMNVGVTTGASGTGDTLLDGIDLNADAVYSSLCAAGSGTNATENTHRMDAKAGTNDYITGKILTADASLLVGKYYIKYMKV